MTPDPSAGWLPFRIRIEADRPEVSWCLVKDGDFSAPFFADTVRIALRSHRPVVTSLEYLRSVADTLPDVRPTGFVFHISRCGSTLLAQFLSQASHSVVFSEPGPLEDILGAVHAPHEVRVRWLRAAMKVLTAAGRAPRVYVKWDAWHVLDWSLIADAFPQVPSIFLMRDPVEVLVSHQRSPGMHMLPAAIAPQRFSWTLQQVIGYPVLEFRARILGMLLDAALRLADRNALVLDYRELPAAAFERVLPHFDIDPNPQQRARMAEVFSRNSKTPTQPFASDTGGKQAEADETLRSAVQTWSWSVYQRLLNRYIGDTVTPVARAGCKDRLD